MGKINRQEVINLLNSATKKEKELLKHTQKETGQNLPSSTDISVQNCQNSHFEIYQNSTIITKERSKRTTVKRQYPSGTIGANGLIIDNIDGLMKKIIDARCEIAGRDARIVAKVFYSQFNKQFGINTKKAIYDFKEERADEILEYLNELYSKTRKGRVEKAASKKGYNHSIGHYFRLEKELLEKLNKSPDDYDLADLRKRLFNVESRKDLTPAQWKNYIMKLERKVENQLK